MFPLHESGPHYVTSARLVVDSIAPWILRQVHDLGFWKFAVSLPFEQKIIATLQEHGFTAGPVEKRTAIGRRTTRARLLRTSNGLSKWLNQEAAR